MIKKSSTNWEDSYFGGYKKILIDYPEIKVPWDISADLPDDANPDLTYYSGRKLTDILQLKIKEFGLKKAFLSGAEIKEESNFWSGKKKVLIPISKAVEFTVDVVIEKDAELGNLFRHYRQDLIGTKFKYSIKDDDNEKGKPEGKGEGDGESEKSEKQALAKAILRAGAMIDEIKKYRNIFGMTDEEITGEHKKHAVFKLMKENIKPTKYSQEETLRASQLIKMLDITFDPERDKIGDLRSGKLDVSKLGSVPAGNHHVYYRIEEDQTTRPFSVCMLMDESGSMGGNVNSCSRGYTQKKVAKILYKAFSEILPANKIFVYGHSSINKRGEHGMYMEVPEIRIYNDNFNQNFEKTIDQQDNNAWSNNYDGPVIECVYERVREATSDNIIFISISDGQPAGVGYGGYPAIVDMKRIIEKCKRDGFVTVGIGVQYDGVQKIYNYNTVVRDLKAMPGKVSTLVNCVVKTEFQT